MVEWWQVVFISPWAWLTIELSALLAVVWIGYKLATKTPLIPLEKPEENIRAKEDKRRE